MADGEQWPSKLVLKTSVKPGHVTETIRQWYEYHPESLVILDTMSKNRHQSAPGANAYLADYQFGSRLKEVVDESPGSALLAVHHTRKMGSEDFVDGISGTRGIGGSADYLLVLKRKRNSNDAVLHVTGRDINENEYALTVDNGCWQLDGESLRAAADKIEERREQQSSLSARSLKAVKFVNSRESTSPKELAEHLGITNKVAGNLLASLADGEHIAKDGRGTYVSISR